MPRPQGLGSKTSKYALKSLDNSSFEVDLYMLGRSLTLDTVVNANFLYCWRLLVNINAWLTYSLSQVLIHRNSAISTS